MLRLRHHLSATAGDPLRGKLRKLATILIFTARQWLATGLLLTAVGLSLVATGQSGAPAIAPVNLSGEPLHAASGGDKPSFAIALSVAYPAAGAQYAAEPASTSDASYSNANEYLGYYDAESCYAYNKAPTETPAPGLSAADYQRFDRSGVAFDRMCGDAFSGNFLNWATGSAMDMLRLALSGGDRFIDTASLTILQRAVLPNGDPVCMFNTVNFPAKQLQNGGGGNGRYWGAVPAAMVASAAGSDIWVGNTLNRIYFGVKREGSCGTTTSYVLGAPDAHSKPGTGLNTEGFFYARVQVCNADAGRLQDVRDYGLCTAYPSGNFKPTGSIQKYSHQLRLAALGYLMDQTDSNAGGRYGGVLRAPMKFVGSKTFAINGSDNTAVGGNPGAEWNASTGVFYANPDGDAMNISGVVNYVNQLGRTGTVAGRYKSYDPATELYYESLRYLQGLPPSDAAIANITAAMKDGFPVTSSWADPYGGSRPSGSDYSCLKSAIVLIGQPNAKVTTRLPVGNSKGNVPDSRDWTSVVQQFEKNARASYLDGQGVSRPTANPNTALNPAPSADPIIGAAYWANTHDIRGTSWATASGPSLQRPGLRVKSYFFDVNKYGNTSNADYRRYSNPFFTAAKYGGFETEPLNAAARPYNTFGNPFKREDGSADNKVWQDSTRAEEASSYYSQASPRGVLAAFDSIFSKASSSARSIAGAAMSAKTLDAAGGTAYQASFDSADWSGDVLAFPVAVAVAEVSRVVSVGSTPKWTAAGRLGALVAPALSRRIVIGNPGATASPAATWFTWSSIGFTLQNRLNKPATNASADGLGEARLNYLRGDQSREDKPFRRRSKLLGDIVNSGIVYSGAPPSSLGADLHYAEFHAKNANRTQAVFVGANDAMLHAFDARSGNELFAYIPSWMGGKLTDLTAQSYNAKHQSYVDATPVVAEARTGTAGTAADWKTVLVSGTGGGGSGVFALDVTQPAAFTPASVLWEFTRADDADLGYVVGRPQIVKARTSAPGVAQVYRWFAMVASGVNNYLPDPAFGGAFSASGKPALFMLALDKPVGAAWTATGATPNYYKISLPIDATLSATTPPGLINFRATLGQAAELSQIYMGDLHGNLWRLDFSLRGSAEWTMDKLPPYKKGSLAPFTPYPLYIAKDDTGKVQPISMAPSLVAGPASGRIPGTHVFFATGKFLEATDKTSTAQNSIYAVYDNGSTKADSSPVGASVITGRGRLQAGAVNLLTGTVAVPAFKWGRATSNGDTSQRSGWFLDFPVSGERAIHNASIVGDQVVLASLIPVASTTTASCAAAGDGGKQYLLNIDTGRGGTDDSKVGVLGEPVLAELLSATTYSAASATGRRVRTVVKQLMQQGSRGIAAGASVASPSAAGRLSWRQINNYQDLKDAQ